MSSIRFKSTAAAAFVAAGALALSACGDSGSAAEAATGSSDDPIRIGVVTAAEPYWDEFTDLAAEEGINVEFVNFTDYQLPNQALTDGDLDLNQFQHLLFLAQYNAKADGDLVAIGSTAVYPLGIYSTKHASPEDIPDGGEVAIPNDATNQARALLVLQEAGLVELADGGNAFSTPADVLDSSRVKVTPVDAAQTPLALEDVDASIINNDFVGKAGLSADDAIFSDDPESDAAAPYINIWAARADDADNPTFAKLAEIYHDSAVEDGVQEVAGGTAAFLDKDPADLQDILTGLQNDIDG